MSPTSVLLVDLFLLKWISLLPLIPGRFEDNQRSAAPVEHPAIWLLGPPSAGYVVNLRNIEVLTRIALSSSILIL
jgi:hypothetical protein